MPTEVLSGGQYDKLMQKMGKHYGAIGFAVYHNVLERFYMAEGSYDVDTILLYEEKDDVADVLSVLRQLKCTGISVAALPAVTPKLKYRRLLKLQGKEACVYETND